MPNHKLSSQFTERSLQFAVRLKELVKAYKNASSLAREVGVAEGTIRKWASGASQPKIGEVELLAQALGVNLLWLATGEGPKYPEVRAGPCESAPCDRHVEVKTLRKAIEAVELMGKDAPSDRKAAAVALVYERLVQTDGQAGIVEVMRIIQAALAGDTPYI